jgi:hypothetical protein
MLFYLLLIDISYPFLALYKQIIKNGQLLLIDMFSLLFPFRSPILLSPTVEVLCDEWLVVCSSAAVAILCLQGYGNHCSMIVRFRNGCLSLTALL